MFQEDLIDSLKKRLLLYQIITYNLSVFTYLYKVLFLVGPRVVDQFYFKVINFTESTERD